MLISSIDPLALPPRRFHPGACAVCLTTQHLKPCSKCSLISYCSDLHREIDAQYHEPFCKVCATFGNHSESHTLKQHGGETRNGKKNEQQKNFDGRAVESERGVIGKHIDLTTEHPLMMENITTDNIPSVCYKTLFFEVGLDSKYLHHPDELMRWKDEMIFQIGCLLNRSLDPFEMQMILFPRLCCVCLNDNPLELTPCPACHSLFFCRLHRHDLNKHQREKFSKLQFQPCRHLTQQTGQQAAAITPGDEQLELVNQETAAVTAANVSLCLLLRQALDCDRKEQLLGIENVDEILVPYFNHQKHRPSIARQKTVLQWMDLFFANSDGPIEHQQNSSRPDAVDARKKQKTEEDSSLLSPVGDISRILLSDPLSYPLTLLHAMQHLIHQSNWKPRQSNRLILHIVGAESHRELLGLTRWEIVMHDDLSVKMGFNEIEFIFIGTALECDLDEGRVESLPLEETRNPLGEIPLANESRNQSLELAEETRNPLANESRNQSPEGSERPEAEGNKSQGILKTPTPSSLLYYQRNCGYWDRQRCYLTISGLNCANCASHHKSSIYRVFPCMSYEQFVDYWSPEQQDQAQQSNLNPDHPPHWTVPDLVVAFNCGFHVAMDDVEVWERPSLNYLVQSTRNQESKTAPAADPCWSSHAPLLFTSLNVSECQQDLAFLQSGLQHLDLKILAPPSPNPYSSQRPVRDASGGDSCTSPTIYLSNAASCLVTL